MDFPVYRCVPNTICGHEDKQSMIYFHHKLSMFHPEWSIVYQVGNEVHLKRKWDRTNCENKDNYTERFDSFGKLTKSTLICGFAMYWTSLPFQSFVHHYLSHHKNYQWDPYYTTQHTKVSKKKRGLVRPSFSTDIRIISKWFVRCIFHAWSSECDTAHSNQQGDRYHDSFC